MVVARHKPLLLALSCFLLPGSTTDNDYLIRLTSDGEKIKSVVNVNSDECASVCNLDSIQDWKINPDCDGRIKSNCRQAAENDFCEWNNDKQQCRVTLMGQPRQRSITAYISEYAQGVSLEIAPEENYVCTNMVNAPTSTLWSMAAQGILYFLMLVYSFLGVAIVADIFMSAIETITSKEREVVVKDDAGESVTLQVRVWNETVANLTLLALGSSAPEILLATLETVTTLGDPAGELGPSTIVGSAAFNLFMITAVCMISVPPAGRDELGIRKISELGVFLITAASSVFAYLWLFLCIVVFSNEFIDLWEAFVTFGMFPILVIFAYLQDTHKLTALFGGGSPDEALEHRGMEKIKIENVKKDPSAKLAQQIEADASPAKRSYMVYRVNAIRGLTGKKKVVKDDSDDVLAMELAKLEEGKDKDGPKKSGFDTTIEFSTQEYAVREDAGSITIAVTRSGKLDDTHLVNYATVDGSAMANDDYMPTEATLKFGKGERVKTFKVEVIEDENVELDEFFYVTLSDPTGPSVSLGGNKICTIKILDVSNPGRVGFKHEFKRCQESVGKVKVSVQRKEGAMGSFFVDWRTQDGTAVDNIDYKGGKGTLKFDAGEMIKDIMIDILDNEEHDDRDRSFEVVLSNPQNENKTAQLYPQKKVCRVDISDDEQYSQVVNKIMTLWNKQKKQLSLSTGSWHEQFEEAAQCPDDPKALDFFLHGLSFPWKMLFAFLPPTGYCNGWVTFFSSLAVIGIVTFFIGEFAGTFGCMMGINKPIVAITIVALGTSMPDTFASRTATIMAPDADAAVGNVTGSNSVNVFLGLGLPWVIATVYAEAKGERYIQPEGTIAFSVMIFTPCALICLATLLIRRKIVGGELGGSPFGRWLTFGFFAFLWAFFIVMSILKDSKVI